MNHSNLMLRKSLYVGIILGGSTLAGHAFTLALQEQSGLIGAISGGGGPVVITPVGPDHWTVSVSDPRIGNPTSPTLNLAFIEPELVGGLTAYNNVQVLSVNPGVAVFDVLSDEFSPYSTVVANNTSFLIQGTDIEPIFMKFNDIADTIPEPQVAGLLLASTALLVFLRTRR